jgi:hypothetical protein
VLSPCGTPPLYKYIEYSTRDHDGSERIDVAYVQARQTISIFDLLSPPPRPIKANLSALALLYRVVMYVI